MKSAESSHQPTSLRSSVNGKAAAAADPPESPDPAPVLRLSVGRSFSADRVHPSTLPRTHAPGPPRSVQIADGAGTAIFERTGISAPAEWSDQAVTVVAAKFFRGDVTRGDDPRQGGCEHSVYALVDRVVSTIADWAAADGYFGTGPEPRPGVLEFRDELAALMLGQYAAFNSPVWFNVGLGNYGIHADPAGSYIWSAADDRAIPNPDIIKYPQCHACFIQSVNDDMRSIMRLATSEAMLFKHGSGTGTDLSTLRSSREKLSGGGKPSGPVSFLVIYDAIASIIKSGGKTRRAAKMNTLKCWHPDIVEFIDCKAKEEKKAVALLASKVCKPGMTGHPDEASASVKFQNLNASVRVTDAFMARATSADPEFRAWSTIAVTTGAPVQQLDASELLDRIALRTWECGDPGLQYEDTIQRWHTTPNGINGPPGSTPINSSNPCSEYMSVDDSACNLASIRLTKFRKPGGGFRSSLFRDAVRTMIPAMDALIDRACYPTPEIAANAHAFRQLGLGYCDLGALLMSEGLPYDSPRGRDLAGSITALMTAEAYLTSIELARILGPCRAWDANREPMMRVMKRHRDAAWDLWLRIKDGRETAVELAFLASGAWDRVLEDGAQYGFRNSQVTVLAPTGTIAFMMDCDSTGVEPAIALVADKQLSGGGTLKLAVGCVPAALESLGYAETRRTQILNHLAAGRSIEDSSGLESADLPVFDCALPPRPGGRTISVEGHVRMIAAVQPFLSGGVSKTCNLPASATVEEIRAAYVLGWQLGAKSLSVYRDASKEAQPLSVGKSAAPSEAIQPVPVRPNDEAALSLLNPGVPWTATLSGEILSALRAGSLIASQPAPEVVRIRPRRERLPESRRGLTHHFSVDGHEGYATLGFYPDGRPGELFVRMAKEGSTIGGLMDSLAIAVSIGLQYGVPPDVFISKFSHSRFEPSGFTRNPEIPHASSVVDYLFRWIALELARGGAERLPPLPPVSGGAPDRHPAPPPAVLYAGRTCSNCGHLMVRTGSCYCCRNCLMDTGCG